MLFPRIIFQRGRFCGIAIANPNNSQAEVRIQAYYPDGTAFQSPVALTVPAGSQISKLAVEILAPPSSIVESTVPTRLWLEAVSSTDGLTGFYLEGTDVLDMMDGSALGGKGINLVLPLVENTGASVTEISLVNPEDTEAAAAQIDFMRDDGSIAASAAGQTIPKRGALQGPLSDLFKIDFNGITSLRVKSDRPLVCYASILRQSDNSLITLPAQNAALPSKTLYFPQLAQGDIWRTSIGLANSLTDQVLVSLTAYQSDGSLFAAPTVTQNPISVVINGGGSLRAAVGQLFGFRSTGLQQGWIKAEASSPALHGYVEYGAGSNRALVLAHGSGLGRFIFSHQALIDPWYTGLAVLNAGSLATNVEVVSIRNDGAVLGKSQQALRPGQRLSFLMQQWVPAAAGINGGTVYVKSDSPVIGTQLFGTTSGALLANVPPQSAPSSYDPGSATPTLKLTPPLAVVETGKTLKFTSSGAGGLAWSVNGVKEGNSTVGTITAAGLYAAPAIAPADNTLTVVASTTTGTQSGGATVDVVQRETLTSGLSLVTAVAYIENLSRFFVAEQQLLSAGIGAVNGPSAASSNARIYEQQAAGPLVPFLEIAGETLGKMLPFSDGAGNSHLLLAGSDTGNLYRLNVASRQLQVFASGLHKPTSLAFESISGDLLVAEEDGLSVIPRSQFDPTAAASPFSSGGGLPHLQLRIPINQVRGIGSNACYGSVFVTLADGTLREFRGNGQRILLSNLSDPRQILVLYRQAPTCAEGLTLMVAEAGKITLYFPYSGKSLNFLSEIQGGYDLSFFPKDRPFQGGSDAVVVLADRGPGSSRILRIRVGGIYRNVPQALPDLPGVSGFLRDPFGDTFETALSGRNQLEAPDILAVNLEVVAGSPVVAITFDRPVAPPRAGLPNSINGFIDIDYLPGGTAPHVAPYNPFSLKTDFGMDAYIDFAKERLFFGSQFSESSPVGIKYLGEVVAIRFGAGQIDPSKIRFAIVVGNRLEMTDVFPNLGAIRLTP